MMSDSRLRLLYDISVLGNGHANVLARTGIYRVAENVALGLVDSAQVAMELCACSSLELYFHARDFHAESARFRPLPFSTPPRPRTLEHRLQYAVVENTLKHGYAHLNTRIMRKFTRMAFPRSTGAMPLFDPASAEAAQIYHSPNFPIPEAMRAYPNLQCFLTVYDLIPIKFPHFFGELAGRMKAGSEQTLGSLRPEDWVLCISEATKRDLCEYRPDLAPERMIVTPLAASRDFYQVTDQAAIQRVKQKYHIPDGPYLLSLSTLEPRKNIDHVIRAFVKLVQEQHLPDLSLVLVGAKGWDSARIFSAIDTSGGIIDRIIVTGYVEDADLPALYSGALAFAYMSFYEGFGLPPLEAMQCGVPVITSNTSSLPEVVGEAGLQLDPCDLDGLCQAIWEIYAHASVREAMACKSLARAQSFSWDGCVAKTIAAYQHACNIGEAIAQ